MEFIALGAMILTVVGMVVIYNTKPENLPF